MNEIDAEAVSRYDKAYTQNEGDLNDMPNPIITIEMENGDVMKAELYPDVAPNTVNNFISLVNKGFYDGLIFHRVIKGFMIQGGCPEGTGMGGPGYSIRGEFSQNGFHNELRHTAGVLSMARAMHPDSAGSQFFIMHEDSPHLDGAYAAFGMITEGMDVVNKIAAVRTDWNDRPMKEQKIKTITVETFGRDLPGAGEEITWLNTGLSGWTAGNTRSPYRTRERPCLPQPRRAGPLSA